MKMHFSHGDENVIVLINKLNKMVNECRFETYPLSFGGTVVVVC